VRSFGKEQQHGGSSRKDTVVNSQKGSQSVEFRRISRVKYEEFLGFEADFSEVYD
jgi:hypothetical protein